MNLAIATCSNLPGWEKDDEPFHQALTERGIRFSTEVWDGPDVDWETYDACLIRTTWDYMEKHAAFVAWARQVGEKIPFFNHPDVITWNTHKSYLRILEECGIPIAPTIWLKRGATLDLENEMRTRGWERGFLKPMVGATARETLRFRRDQEGLSKANDHLCRTLQVEDMMVQPYLHHVETKGELSVIFLGGEISHAVQKIPVPGDYRVQDDFGAKDFPIELSGPQSDLARRVVSTAEAQLNCLDGVPLLYARVDFLWDNDEKLCVTELELVEPSLFFRHSETAPSRFVDVLVDRIG